MEEDISYMSTKDLLRQASSALANQDKTRLIYICNILIARNDNNERSLERAWLYLGLAAEDLTEKEKFFEKCLSYNEDNKYAAEKLKEVREELQQRTRPEAFVFSNPEMPKTADEIITAQKVKKSKPEWSGWGFEGFDKSFGDMSHEERAASTEEIQARSKDKPQLSPEAPKTNGEIKTPHKVTDEVLPPALPDWLNRSQTILPASSKPEPAIGPVIGNQAIEGEVLPLEPDNQDLDALNPLTSYRPGPDLQQQPNLEDLRAPVRNKRRLQISPKIILIIAIVILVIAIIAIIGILGLRFISGSSSTPTPVPTAIIAPTPTTAAITTAASETAQATTPAPEATKVSVTTAPASTVAKTTTTASCNSVVTKNIVPVYIVTSDGTKSVATMQKIDMDHLEISTSTVTIKFHRSDNYFIPDNDFNGISVNPIRTSVQNIQLASCGHKPDDKTVEIQPTS